MPLSEFGRQVTEISTMSGDLRYAEIIAQIRTAIEAEKTFRWTRYLVFATVGLALATFGLVLATVC